MINQYLRYFIHVYTIIYSIIQNKYDENLTIIDGDMVQNVIFCIIINLILRSYDKSIFVIFHTRMHNHLLYHTKQL